jgi:zinc transport system ATP-binding protein
MSESHNVVFKNVFFSYKKESILEDVCLTVKKGDFASIVGPNGSGKTTLLKLILGLIKPDTGEITVLGNSPQKSRIRIGYMPQYAHLDIQFPVTVMDVALMGRVGRSLGGKYTQKDREAALLALEEVQLADHAKYLFKELSGGQRQRVLIARALCCEPELLLLDEPTSNVDPDMEEAFFEILQELNKRMTILFVSHDLGFVSQVVKSVICVNRCVVVHPTTELDGKLIKEIYRGDICMIRHDHRCSEEGHSHD